MTSPQFWRTTTPYTSFFSLSRSSSIPPSNCRGSIRSNTRIDLMPRTLPFQFYSIHCILSSYLATFSDLSRWNSCSTHYNLVNHRCDTFLATKQYMKYAQIRVFHMRSSLFRIPQSSMIRPIQICTD